MKSMEEQLKDLLELPENWDSYGGNRISPETTEHVKNFLANTWAVPTSDGGIQLEWHIDGYDLEIEFDKNGIIDIFFEKEK